MPSPTETERMIQAAIGGVAGCNVETLAAGKQLTVADVICQKLDPAGDRTVVLPSGASSVKGHTFTIFNAASTEGELITVNMHAAESSTTVAILDKGATVTVVWSGSSWVAMGELINTRTKLIEVTGNTTLTAEQSGAIVVCDLTAEVTLTLPAVAEGLHFKVAVWLLGAEGLEVTCPSAFFKGGVVHLDADIGGAGIEVATVVSDNDSNLWFAMDVAAAGTLVEFICDGTNWFVTGTVIGASVPLFGDTTQLPA